MRSSLGETVIPFEATIIPKSKPLFLNFVIKNATSLVGTFPVKFLHSISIIKGNPFKPSIMELWCKTFEIHFNTK